MSKSINFTNKQLSRIKPPKTGRETYKDLREKGLILLASYGGSMVYYLYKKVNGRPRRIKIGSFPDLSVTEARLCAADLKSQIAKGKVLSEHAFTKLNFKQLFDKFIDDYAKLHKKTWRQDIAIMEKYGKSLYNMKISLIDINIIEELFKSITVKSGKVSANRFLALLSTVFNHAIRWEMLQVNPAVRIKKHKEKSRDRYLTTEELPRFVKAIKSESNQKIKDFILLLLYTGARKSNVLAMKWKDINFEDRVWYIEDTKNGDSHIVPLIDPAIDILGQRVLEASSGYVFASESSSSGHIEKIEHVWRSIIARADIEDLRLHDLRRTMGSWMARTGTSLCIIGEALNHKSQQSTAIYARLDTDSVRRSMTEALKLFTENIAEIAEKSRKMANS